MPSYFIPAKRPPTPEGTWLTADEKFGPFKPGPCCEEQPDNSCRECGRRVCDKHFDATHGRCIRCVLISEAVEAGRQEGLRPFAWLDGACTVTPMLD